MFTPDNFYEVLHQCFIDVKKDLAIRPHSHGDKDLFYYVPWMHDGHQSFFATKGTYKMSLSRIFLYDQEPILAQSGDTLRQYMLDQNDPQHHQHITQCNLAEIVALWHASTSFPIWCTSDGGGGMIDQLADRDFIICDYWYHAFIAREWYRHHQYLPSLMPEDKSSRPYRMVMYCRDDQGTRAYRPSVKSLLEPFSPYILHDWEGQHRTGPELSAVIDTDHAQRSGIHLVLETLFDSDKHYLTEKVFKPMVMSQAFIIWAPPHTLKYLREHGFRTFDHVWSEQYDDEHDPELRMQLLRDLVEKIAGLSQQDYQKLYHECLPTIEHNRKWFYNSQFMDGCWNQLQHNWQQAQRSRAAMTAAHPGGQFFRLLDEQPDLMNLGVPRSMAKQYLASLDSQRLTVMLKQYPAIRAL